MWVARDKSGTLKLDVFGPPTRIEEQGIWCCEDMWCFIPNSLFPELKWEDEPIDVELITKSEHMSLQMLSALYREDHKDNLWVN